MRYRTLLLVVSAFWVVTASGSAFSQQEQILGTRKVLNLVQPAYPEIARLMRLKGTVKIEALVSNNGVVKSVGIKGGHPVLAQAAASAVRRWKWEPAARETKEPIEVTFDPKE